MNYMQFCNNLGIDYKDLTDWNVSPDIRGYLLSRFPSKNDGNKVLVTKNPPPQSTWPLRQSEFLLKIFSFPSDFDLKVPEKKK